jgi:6-phosphofructokinase 1
MARGENCLIAVAGAPTSVTNSALAGILDEMGKSSDIGDIYGAVAGFTGLLDGKVIDLGAQKRKVIEGLRRTPSSVLSGRHRPLAEADSAPLVAALREHQIGSLFLLGGLPAVEAARFVLAAANAAGLEINVLVVPLSAENEVDAGDHTPGYGSAARFASVLAREAGRAAQGGEEPVLVLEIAGAASGWLAAASVLARDAQNAAPHSIILPEQPVDAESLVEELKRAVQKYGYALAVTTEGAHDTQGNSLDGAALAELLEDKLNLPTRFDRLGITSRVSGANISRIDSDEAYDLAGLAVRLSDDGCSGFVVALGRDGDAKSEKGYKTIEKTLPLDQIVDQPRVLPAEFINESGTGVTPAFLEWIKPLAGGAMPDYASLGDGKAASE